MAWHEKFELTGYGFIYDNFYHGESPSMGFLGVFLGSFDRWR